MAFTRSRLVERSNVIVTGANGNKAGGQSIEGWRRRCTHNSDRQRSGGDGTSSKLIDQLHSSADDFKALLNPTALTGANQSGSRSSHTDPPTHSGFDQTTTRWRCLEQRGGDDGVSIPERECEDHAVSSSKVLNLGQDMLLTSIRSVDTHSRPQSIEQFNVFVVIEDNLKGGCDSHVNAERGGKNAPPSRAARRHITRPKARKGQ
eukprot:GHVN01006189.1.p2 GENE.GHVN01006189.1~~GHVN01006189.1.p2  ORF type:complete len:205 (-),score=32.90 GHVN01006189.1:230-844(-)